MMFCEYIKSLFIPDPDEDLSEERSDPVYNSEELNREFDEHINE